MQVICRSNRFVVIDDLFPEEMLHALWKTFGHEGQIPAFQKWSKVWDFGPGLAWTQVSNFYNVARAEDEAAGRRSWYSVVGGMFLKIAEHFPELIRPGWDDLRLHYHMYGQGTRLGWHVDHHSSCSFTWYPHPEWRSSWGGEMLVAEAPALEPGIKLVLSLDRRQEDALLTDGLGTYIAPKPNRLVLLAPGMWHSVARVDQNAGDALRCSVVGFLVKKEVKPAPVEDKVEIQSNDHPSM